MDWPPQSLDLNIPEAVWDAGSVIFYLLLQFTRLSALMDGINQLHLGAFINEELKSKNNDLLQQFHSINVPYLISLSSLEQPNPCKVRLHD